jgi:pyruvate,water dikinase
VDTVLRALPHNPTTEMDLQLFGLSHRLRSDPEAAARLGAGLGAAARAEIDPRALAKEYLRGELPSALQRALAEFLEVYGARGVAEIDVGMPRWRDDPTHLLGSLQNYLALPKVGDPSLPDPERQFQNGAAEAAAMVEELCARAGRRSRLRAMVVRFLLSRVRELCGLREAPKFYAVRVFGQARQLLSRLGTGLAAAGRLTQADGIFFLTLAQARQAALGADLREVEKGQRKTYARELLRRHLPRILLSDGSEPQGAAVAGGAQGPALQGTPASAGQVTGVARVVLDPQGAQLLPGEILVAPSTDPGWTPLFLTAGGLVMEMGGAMSHGAVVAREYGIPAVVGVAPATERIRTGDRILVDGTQGAVTVTPAGA